MKNLFKRFLAEWEEEKKFSNLKSVIKAKSQDLIAFLDKIATHKGKESWLVVPPNSKSKICLVAHIDRIFDNPHQKKKVIPKKHGEKKELHSPHGISGDDRCGVYGLLHIYRTLPADKRPYILFTDKEEKGLFGAKEAVNVFDAQLKDIDFFIELDRQGSKDMVFYNNEPKEFEQHIGKHGFEKSIGTTSDIKILGKHFNKKSVNVSVGYYGQHTKNEYIVVKQLLDTIEKVKGICVNMEASPKQDWKYTEPKYEYHKGSWLGRSSFNDGEDDWWDAYKKHKKNKGGVTTVDDDLPYWSEYNKKKELVRPKWSAEDEKNYQARKQQEMERYQREKAEKNKNKEKEPTQLSLYDKDSQLYRDWVNSGSKLRYVEWLRAEAAKAKQRRLKGEDY